MVINLITEFYFFKQNVEFSSATIPSILEQEVLFEKFVRNQKTNTFWDRPVIVCCPGRGICIFIFTTTFRSSSHFPWWPVLVR